MAVGVRLCAVLLLVGFLPTATPVAADRGVITLLVGGPSFDFILEDGRANFVLDLNSTAPDQVRTGSKGGNVYAC
jgi:hypothetical protein